MSTIARPDAAPATRRTPLGRSFWSLWGGATASSIGDGLLLAALPLLAASITRSPGLVAGVLVAQQLPWLVLALPAGAVVDRFHRGRVMAAVDVGRCTILAAVGVAVATGTISLPLLYAGAFLLGALETIYTSAALAAVPALVERRQLDRANGVLFAGETAGGQLAGPALGGLLFALVSSAPFLVDAASYLVAAAVVYFLRDRLPAPPRATRTTLRTDIVVGLRWFWCSRLSRLLSALVGCLAFCQAMVMGVLVLYGLEVLDLSTAGYGVFLGVGAVGNVLGGLAADRVRSRFGISRVLVGGGVAAALAYVVVSTTANPYLAGAMFVVESFAVAVGNVASISLRQTIVPDALLGRVGNIFRTVIYGAIPLGSLTGGLLAGAFGLRAPFLVAGAVQLACMAVLAAPFATRAGAVEADDEGDDDVVDLRATPPVVALPEPAVTPSGAR